MTSNQQSQQLTLGTAGKSHVVNADGHNVSPLSPICPAATCLRHVMMITWLGE